MANFYFVDTSALGKRYFMETGSVWISGLLNPAVGHTAAIVRTTTVEMIAAISRRERGGSLTPADAASARAEFRSDLANEYQVVELSPKLSDQAMMLAERHGLRGYDAIQLSAALEVNAFRTGQGLPPITLLSADAELNAAALHNGLIVDDPNHHP